MTPVEIIRLTIETVLIIMITLLAVTNNDKKITSRTALSLRSTLSWSASEHSVSSLLMSGFRILV